MPKIGELTALGVFKGDVLVPGFDPTDPANPDVKIPLSLLTGDPTTASNVGVVGAVTVAASERGDGRHHQTVLTLTSFAVGLSADNASLGLGALFYTLPAGAIAVRTARIKGGVTIADAVTTDTPEIGIGTVVATGAVSVLGGTTTFENVFEGTAVADVNGTEFNGLKKATAAPYELLIPASGVHTLFLNLAAVWANLTAASALTFTGTITLEWDFLGT